MYKEKELLGKEVISSEGAVIGEVIEVIMKDDIPFLVVGEKSFLVGKERIMQSDKTFTIPYYEITTVHDKVMISKSVQDLQREKI